MAYTYDNLLSEISFLDKDIESSGINWDAIPRPPDFGQAGFMGRTASFWPTKKEAAKRLLMMRNPDITRKQADMIFDSEKDLNERNRHSTDALQKINLVTIEIIGETIEHIRTPDSFVTEKEFIIDFLQNCDKKTYELIKETNIKLRQSTETKPLQIKCVACSHEYSQPFTLNITDFFE